MDVNSWLMIIWVNHAEIRILEIVRGLADGRTVPTAIIVMIILSASFESGK